MMDWFTTTHATRFAVLLQAAFILCTVADDNSRRSFIFASKQLPWGTLSACGFRDSATSAATWSVAAPAAKAAPQT